jgi:hypothetical protein
MANSSNAILMNTSSVAESLSNPLLSYLNGHPGVALSAPDYRAGDSAYDARQQADHRRITASPEIDELLALVVFLPGRRHRRAAQSGANRKTPQRALPPARVGALRYFQTRYVAKGQGFGLTLLRGQKNEGIVS